MDLGLLKNARRYTDEDRARAQARVEIERINLRERLLLRDRAEYLRLLGDVGTGLADFSDEEIALLDLDVDHLFRALEMASRDERAAFDRAVWAAVERNLWLLPRVRLPSCGDAALDQAHCLDGLRDAIMVWNPGRGRLGTIVGPRVWTHRRREIQRRGRLAASQVGEPSPDESLHESDTLLRRVLVEGIDRLPERDREALLRATATDSGTYAREAGIGRSTARKRIADARRKIRERLEALGVAEDYPFLQRSA